MTYDEVGLGGDGPQSNRHDSDCKARITRTVSEKATSKQE